MEKRKSLIFLFLAASFILVMLSMPLHIASAQAEPQLHEPLVFPNNALSTGEETIWSCINFGHYPSAEVVRSGWDSVDSYAVRDGDVIRDDELYTRLNEAEWTGDRLILDGQKYIRINRTDAVTAAPDREQHYRWDDPDEWHYFAEQPIKWRILSLKDGKALLLSDRVLDCFPFNLTDEEVNWQNSTVRSWLNGPGAEDDLSGRDHSGAEDSFLSAAFTENERLSILRSDLQNSENHYFGTSCGPDTEDQVFLLSEDEIFSSPAALYYGFLDSDAAGDPARRFAPTAYALGRGTWQSDNAGSEGNTFWLLRSNGFTASNVVYVGEMGHIYNRGIPVTCQDAGLVPAIRIDLETAAYSYTGTISSRDRISGR